MMVSSSQLLLLLHSVLRTRTTVWAVPFVASVSAQSCLECFAYYYDTSAAYYTGCLSS